LYNELVKITGFKPLAKEAFEAQSPSFYQPRVSWMQRWIFLW